MITIIYSTHKDQEYNQKFKEHLQNTVGVKDYQILEYQNNNQYSLSEVYNRGISESEYNIIVCIHNDIKLEKNWGRRLLIDFDSNPDYGVIGKAGSCYFPESGIYWERMQQTMVGQVYHHPDGQNKWLNKYTPKSPSLIPVITIDGLFLSFDKTKIKHLFDESIGKFHFYDHGFCLPNYLDDIKIGVTSSFEITHQSVGQPDDEFFQTKDKFVEKYKEHLPLDLKPEFVFKTKVDIKPAKNAGKIAVVIPTKSRNELLFNTIDSYISNCDSSLFEMFIADTGSREDEKNELKNYIKEKSDVVKINLIEYDYYNFAKINNDVVKNHIGPDFKYILFSNNDIKLLNDVIGGMLEVFRKNQNAGTVGCRLHFADNTVQHDGVVGYVSQSKGSLGITHMGLGSYYNYTLGIKKVLGNTAALMMIRRNLFERCGYFNENYVSCFEDVELNLKCLTLGFENYYDGNLVAYHFESQTRNFDPEKNNNEHKDYTQTLLPYINSNFGKLRNYFLFVQ
jgi:GT2 family glycosyltransferase